jgi:saccharopine dehydrogenase (NAD+, L-lysine-forming)
MDKNIFLILGGYGNTGKCIAKLLLKESDIQIILAGRRLEKAQETAEEFNRTFGGNRIKGIYADASDVESLKQAFENVNFVIVASSTAKYVKEIVKVSLESKVDYLDIQYSSEKLSYLKSISDDIKSAGRCFITDGGFHPGLPSAVARYVGGKFNKPEQIIVSSLIKHNWKKEVSDSTIYEFIEEFKNYKPFVFENQEWRKAKMSAMRDYLKIDFSEKFGNKYCAPMTKIFPSIKKTGFYIAGFNWFVDWILMPIFIILLFLFPNKGIKLAGKLFWWTMGRFSSPPYGVILKIDAIGKKNGKLKRVETFFYHEDGYMFTAIPVVACLLQYLDGSIKKPGLLTMGNIVEPNRLVMDMERMGVKVWSEEREEKENK